MTNKKDSITNKLPKLNFLKKKKLPEKITKFFQTPRYKWAVIIVAVLAVLYLARGLFLVAVVNGRVVTRREIVKALEEQQGGQILESRINEILIKQEARDQGVIISPEDVETEVQKIEDLYTQNGQDFEEALQAQGTTREMLSDQYEFQLLVEAMLKDKIAVTDEDVDAYIVANSQYFEADYDPEVIRPQVKEMLEQQQLGLEYIGWLNGLKEKAKIKYFFEY